MPRRTSAGDGDLFSRSLEHPLTEGPQLPRASTSFHELPRASTSFPRTLPPRSHGCRRFALGLARRCVFEKALSSLVKHRRCFLQLSRADLPRLTADAGLGGGLGLGGDHGGDGGGGRAVNFERAWGMLVDACRADRPPPMAPDAFESRMTSGCAEEVKAPGGGIRFTNGKDLTDVVIPQYRAAFLRLFSSTPSLSYSNLGWGDREAAALADALRYAAQHGATARIVYIGLRYNEVGDAGVRALASVLRVPRRAWPALRGVCADDNPASEEALAALYAKAPNLKWRVSAEGDVEEVGDDDIVARASA